MIPPPHLLPAEPAIPAVVRQHLTQDFERFARAGLPCPLEPFLQERYQLDVGSTYAGLPIRNPWGKASGQLSMTLHQIEEDAGGDWVSWCSRPWSPRMPREAEAW